MAFFEEAAETQEEVVEKIKVGEKEFTQDELSNLVGLGETARELESKWNTSVDKLYPEFTKSRQEIKQLREEKESWEKEKNLKPDVPEDEQIRQAREAAKKVGLVTDDVFDERMGKSFRDFYVRERAAERLLDEAGSLEGKYDGKDGRPRFNRDEILNYMGETGIRNPEQAYKMKYESDIDAWKEKQLRSVGRVGLVTETSTNAGGKMPSPVKVTKENFAEMAQRAMDGEL